MLRLTHQCWKKQTLNRSAPYARLYLGLGQAEGWAVEAEELESALEDALSEIADKVSRIKQLEHSLAAQERRSESLKEKLAPSHHPYPLLTQNPLWLPHVRPLNHRTHPKPKRKIDLLKPSSKPEQS